MGLATRSLYKVPFQVDIFIQEGCLRGSQSTFGISGLPEHNFLEEKFFGWTRSVLLVVEVATYV